MSHSPRIHLVHAGAISMGPIEAAFWTDWPEATLVHLLDDSLSSDFARDGRLTGAMIDRFRTLGRYCAAAGADAILFTCSAFGAAIDVVKSEQKVPVLKPNEALYDDIVATRGRIALLATFAPSLPAMMAEIEAHATAHGVTPLVEPHLVAGAFDALMAKRSDEHDRLIAAAAATFARHDAIAFAQVSMTTALPLTQAQTRIPVMTTPQSAIRKLRTLMG